MKRKHEEELIKLAFGDLDGDSGRAKQLLEEDAEAAKLFAGYDEIRQGLKQLARPVPEHQLSTERLREAILRDGLKREKTSGGFNWRWALAPTAVMACAFLITLKATNDPNVLPEGISSITTSEFSAGGSKVDSAPIDFVETPSNAAALAAKANSTATEPAPEREPRLNTTGLVASASEGSTRVRSASMPIARTAALSPAEISNLAIDGALPAGAVAMVDSAAVETSIVIINADIDDATGAKRATEVTSASNVIIGG